MQRHMLVGLLLLGALGLAAAAYAQSVTCGAVLIGGRHALTEDLLCDQPVDARSILTLRDGATLDLQGHTLEGWGPILLEGRGTTLKNGRLVWCGTTEMCELPLWVTAGGEGGHRLEDLEIHASFAFGTLNLASPSNRVRQVFITGEVGVEIHGNHNVLDRVVVADAGAAGFWLAAGEGNVLQRCTVESGLGVAYHVESSRNLLVGNGTARRMGSTGLLVARGAVRNVLVGNTITGEAPDAWDQNGDCTSNLWRVNTFETAEPACILESGGRMPLARR